jgi:putative aminopeptidase FrvX
MMDPDEFTRLAGRLMACPAAPYHEAGVRTVVELICREHALECQRDGFGNVIVRWGQARVGRPLVLAAHMDHPGFEVIRSLGPGRWEAQFNGGVPDAYFRRGSRIRLLPGATQARLGRRMGQSQRFELAAEPAPESHAPRPLFAVWEMEDFAVRDGCLHGRACDDLVGVAAVLATFIELKRRRSRVHLLGVISRAEEVGFHGALTVAAGSVLPKNSLVVSLETSKEVPPVRLGQGVIVRVGDRSSIFNSAASRFLAEVAAGLREGGFSFQRALMPGGTCEATAYQEHGFQTAALCVALGNYHNCAPGRRIAPEFVNVADACGMVELLVQAARQMPSFPRVAAELPLRLEGLLRQARRRLRQWP